MDTPIIYTVSQLNGNACRLYTKDSRVKDGDRDITVSSSKLINMMIVTSEILNNEGYVVLFEVD